MPPHVSASKLRALIDRVAEALATGEVDLVRDLLVEAKRLLDEDAGGEGS